MPSIRTFIISIFILLSSYNVLADADLQRSSRLLVQHGEIPSEQLLGLERSADGLFLLGWLYEFGRYGVSLNGDKAYGFYQLAAEKGQMDAAHYCWQRCLRMTPALINALKQAAEGGNPQALYLQSKWRADGRAVMEADAQLAGAAKALNPQAISDLYVQYFIDWSEAKRSFAEAESKLNRCADEGVVSCYLLLGTLYQRHGYSEQALLNFMLLEQLDYQLSRRYLSATQLQQLYNRLPKDSLPVIQSRVASRLINHPATGFDVFARFQVCSENATFECVRKVVKEDASCMLGYFADSYLSGLRKTEHYRRCMRF